MSLQVGKYVMLRLSASDDIEELVSDHIYPVVAVAGAQDENFVVFTTSHGSPEYIKGVSGMALEEDSHTVTVDCVHETYGDAIYLAEAVRSALDCKTSDAADDLPFSVTECTMSGATESFDPDVQKYVVSISFEIKTTKNN